jgi:YhfC intramembrane metalloprotease
VKEINESGSSLKQMIVATPIYMLVPIGFIYFAYTLNIPVNYSLMLWGAGGWLVAYLLRVPVAILVQKLNLESNTSQNIIISFSGILEEIVRFTIVFWIGKSFAVAYFIGIGWSAIEVIYAIVTGYFLESIMSRSDPEALEIQSKLREMGMIHDLGVFIGISERLFASMFHIGMTLSIAKWPWFLPLGIVLHSSINLIVTKFQKSSILISHGVVVLTGTVIFFIGLKYS